MNLPLITVAVCSFNGERYLEKTLNSVLAQDYSNFELVVVDDGSSDGTVSVSYTHLDVYKRQVLLRLTGTLGFYSFVWLSLAGAGLNCMVLVYRLCLLYTSRCV